jgi:glyoxylase-like metal-dependent hydrolase (beta-lactamase superfamily II)
VNRTPAPGEDPAEQLALAARAGIHRLAIPTPFLVGRVNCYLLEDRPLTLIDTGPNSGTSLDHLERGLAELGHRVEDLELVVVTHQHVDHGGLLEILTRRSGAEVAAFHELVPWFADYRDSAAADDEFAQAVMRGNGVPEDLTIALSSVAAAFRAYGTSAAVTRPLCDGELVELRDRSLRALHRPGHSPSDTVLLDEQRSILIGGDHLLGRISSNPIITRPLGGRPATPTGPGRPRPLLDYVASLRATAELGADLVLPGHGDPITEHRALISERMRLHERRARKILGILESEPLTAHEIAVRMWGNVAVTQAFLTLSEVLGHLDLLAEQGAVSEIVQDGVARYRAG